MKTLLLVELKRLVPVFLFLYLVALLAFYLFDISTFLLSIPVYCVFISNQHLKRSSWYLNLPWSRAKIIASVATQSLILFLVNIFIVGAFFFFEGKLFFGENKDLVWMAIIGYSTIFIFSFFRSLSGIQIRKVVSWSDLHHNKKLWFIGVFGLLGPILWHLGILGEPTFLVLLLLIAIAGTFSVLLKEFILPAATAGKANKVLKISVVTLFSLLVGCALVAANWDITRNHWTIQAVSFLGRFPSFVPDHRALDLFVNTDMGPNPTLLRHLGYLQANINKELWTTRTLACKSSACLDLSSDVVQTNKLSPVELEQRFLSLMSFCEFQLGEAGQNTCVKGRMKIDAGRVRLWINLLEEKGLLREWLGSGDTKKQIIALKGTPFAVDAEQEKIVRELGDSKDPRIKTAATLFLENSQKFRTLGLNCELEKDQNHAVCKFKAKEYAM